MIVRIQDLTGSGDTPNYFDGVVEPRYEVQAGDLLISWAATLGAYIWRGADAVLNQHIFKVESYIDRTFHYYLVTHILNDLRHQAHGSGMVHITKGKFDSTPVVLPPLAEQRRIVAALEEHLSDLDAAVSALARARVNVNRYRTSRLEQMVIERARVMGWPEATLGVAVARGPQNGLYLPKSAYGSGVPILRIDDFQDWSSRSASEFRRVRVDADTIATYGLRQGDVVINRVNSPSHLGKALVVEPRHSPAVFESNMMRLRLTNEMDPQFVAIYLRTTTGRTRLTFNAKWAVNQASINQQDVLQTPLPMPPKTEQLEVARECEKMVAESERLRSEIDVQLARASRLRRSILKRAFEGKLVPQAANDEPAFALLDRIRASPETAPSPPRRRRASPTRS